MLCRYPDPAILKWLMGQKDLSGRLARWSLKLQAFEFTIEHRKGSLNVVPAALSRVHMDEIQKTGAEELDIHINLDSTAFQSSDYVNLVPKDVRLDRWNLKFDGSGRGMTVDSGIFHYRK